MSTVGADSLASCSVPHDVFPEGLDKATAVLDIGSKFHPFLDSSHLRHANSKMCPCLFSISQILAQQIDIKVLLHQHSLLPIVIGQVHFRDQQLLGLSIINLVLDCSILLISLKLLVFHLNYKLVLLYLLLQAWLLSKAGCHYFIWLFFFYRV